MRTHIRLVRRVSTLVATTSMAVVLPLTAAAATDTATGGSRSSTVTDVASTTATATATHSVERPAAATPGTIRATGCSAVEGTACVVTITLAEPNAAAVSVHYATRNGTARSGRDYVATQGTMTFVPGETSKQVPIPTTTDVECRETSEAFRVDLSTPTNATLATTTVSGRIADGAPDIAATTVALLPLLPYFGEYAGQLMSMLPEMHKVACQLPVIVPLMLDIMPVMQPYLPKLLPLFPVFLPLLPIIAPFLDTPFGWIAIAILRPFIPTVLAWVLPILF